eukprot:1138154-Pelagomonas_calceolata.AAC.2
MPQRAPGNVFPGPPRACALACAATLQQHHRRVEELLGSPLYSLVNPLSGPVNAPQVNTQKFQAVSMIGNHRSMAALAMSEVASSGSSSSSSIPLHLLVGTFSSGSGSAEGGG